MGRCRHDDEHRARAARRVDVSDQRVDGVDVHLLLVHHAEREGHVLRVPVRRAALAPLGHHPRRLLLDRVAAQRPLGRAAARAAVVAPHHLREAEPHAAAAALGAARLLGVLRALLDHVPRHLQHVLQMVLRHL